MTKKQYAEYKEHSEKGYYIGLAAFCAAICAGLGFLVAAGVFVLGWLGGIGGWVLFGNK